MKGVPHSHLRIAYDATYSVGRHLSGVGVYSNEIIKGVASACPDSSFTCAYRPHRFLRALRQHLPGNCRRRILWESRSLHSTRIFHGLNQRLPEAHYPKSAATFHDLFVLTGEYSSAEFRRRFAVQAREAASRADLIIAVSRFTADQVRDLLGVEESRLRVIHHGVRLPTQPPDCQREPMILFVGAIQHRKNVSRLVSSFERIDPEWRLVLAGSAGFGSTEILQQINDSPARKRIQVLGYVPDQALESLYSRAGIFAFPSLDEGFGMPVLEAMAHGVPVITSDRSALPEVAGDAALCVDPTDVEALAGALSSLARDERLRKDLAGRGYERVSEFSWDRTVRRTLAVYEELSS